MTTIAPPRGYDWSFVGLTIYSLVMIRTFAIYVNDTLVAGAFVRGILGSPTTEADDPWSGVSAGEPVADVDREDVVGRRMEQERAIAANAKQKLEPMVMASTC